MKDVVLELPKAELDKLIGTLQQVNQVLPPFPPLTVACSSVLLTTSHASGRWCKSCACNMAVLRAQKKSASSRRTRPDGERREERRESRLPWSRYLFGGLVVRPLLHRFPASVLCITNVCVSRKRGKKEDRKEREEPIDGAGERGEKEGRGLLVGDVLPHALVFRSLDQREQLAGVARQLEERMLVLCAQCVCVCVCVCGQWLTSSRRNEKECAYREHLCGIGTERGVHDGALLDEVLELR